MHLLRQDNLTADVLEPRGAALPVLAEPLQVPTNLFFIAGLVLFLFTPLILHNLSSSESEYGLNNPFAVAPSSTEVPRFVDLHVPRVALAISCEPQYIPLWSSLITSLSEPTRSNLSVFFAVYGSNVPYNASLTKSLSKLVTNLSALEPAEVAYIAPRLANSWTTGRNELMQKIYRHEIERGEQYTYWVFVDADTVHLDCTICSPSLPPNYTSMACCWEQLIGNVLTSDDFLFATLGSVLAAEELSYLGPVPEGSRQFFLRDCTDAQLQAFHREAVPLVLPYQEEHEGRSWWSSQAALFSFTSACLRGSNAVATENFKVRNNQHVHGGGAGVDWGGLDTILQAQNPNIWGHIMDKNRRCQAHIPRASGEVVYQDAVINIQTGETEGAKSGKTLSNISVVSMVRWNETCAFAACNATRYERFVTLVGKGAPEAPRRPGTKVGWVLGWPALSLEQNPPWWSNNSNLSGLTKDCSAHIYGRPL